MANRLRRVIEIGTCLALLGAATPGSAGTAEKIYRRALPSVMTLEVENQAGERFVGSAVMTKAEDVAVTAWHVVCDARSVWATFADGTRIEAIGCLDQDGTRDLALLKLGKRLPGRGATLGDSLQPVASKAYVIGAPKGFGFSISDGLVSQIRQVDGFPQYQISCPISPGNSGGPVLDGRGRVIGIVSWTKSDAQSVSFAIPAREISRLNPGGKLKSWPQLAADPGPLLPPRWIASDRSVSTISTESKVGGLDDLNRHLDQLAGKRITILVQENGQEDKFTFTVPPRPGASRSGW